MAHQSSQDAAYYGSRQYDPYHEHPIASRGHGHQQGGQQQHNSHQGGSYLQPAPPAGQPPRLPPISTALHQGQQYPPMGQPFSMSGQPLPPPPQGGYQSNAHYGAGYYQPSAPHSGHPSLSGQQHIPHPSQQYGHQSAQAPGQSQYPSSSSRDSRRAHEAHSSTPSQHSLYAVPPGAQGHASSSRHGRRPSTSHGAPASPTSPNEARVRCPICDKTFSRQHDCRRHCETAHVQPPPVHRCRHCKKEFSRPDSLKRHMDSGCGANEQRR